MPNIKAEIWTKEVWKYNTAFGAHDVEQDGYLIMVVCFQSEFSGVCRCFRRMLRWRGSVGEILHFFVFFRTSQIF